eukprot:7693179-Heterocapsa_arctica.AAC.1
MKELMMMKDCKLVSSPKVGDACSQEQQTTPLTSEDASRYRSAVARMRDAVDEILEVVIDAGWRGNQHRILTNVNVDEAKLIQS